MKNGYIIASGGTMGDLTEIVNTYLELGAKPQGGIFILLEPDHEGYLERTYFQAMTEEVSE
jgi:hypothetical protein